jgi:hypothetical protein
VVNRTEDVQFLIIKPTRCTNFSNLFLEWNSTCFGQFLCPSSGVLHCIHSDGICHTGLLTFCEQDQDGTAVPPWSCSQAVSKPVWHIPLQCVQWKTPDDGQRNCPKHVEFHSKKKFEKLVRLVGFIVRNYQDARSRERQHFSGCLLCRLPSILGCKLCKIWTRFHVGHRMNKAYITRHVR